MEKIFYWFVPRVQRDKYWEWSTTVLQYYTLGSVGNIIPTPALHCTTCPHLSTRAGWWRHCNNTLNGPLIMIIDSILWLPGGSHGLPWLTVTDCDNPIFSSISTKSRRCEDLSCLDPALWRFVIVRAGRGDQRAKWTVIPLVGVIFINDCWAVFTLLTERAQVRSVL